MIIVTSIKKDKLKKVLRGIAVAIIIYITFSMISTKLVYDYVFKHYSVENYQDYIANPSDVVVTQKEYSYPCNDYLLKGFLYLNNKPQNGLIVFAPGLNAQIVEYKSVIYAFVQRGFDVFAFDPTGHGESGGKSSIGFPQIITDLDATLEFIGKSDDFNYENIFLLGHSRGGFGVCCTMNSYNNIAAAVSVNSVDTSMDAIMAYSTKYVGDIAYGNYPFLSVYQNFLFGSELCNKSASKEINDSKVPVLVIHAKNDEQLSGNKYSLYSKRKKIKSNNVEFLLYDKDGFDGHVSVLYNEDKFPNYDVINKISEFYKQKS